MFSGSVYRRDGSECERDRRGRRREQRREDRGRVEAALVGGPQHTGEDLLTAGAARRAIAAPTHFARDDGGPQRLLGAPVRRVERRLEEEAKDRVVFDDEVRLEYYRLQKIAEGDLVLQIQGQFGLDPTTEAGISRPKEEKDKLSNILHVLNDKYGTEFTDADKIYFDQLEQALFENEDLKTRAQNNPIENFKYAFEEVFIQTLIDRMKDNELRLDANPLFAAGPIGDIDNSKAALALAKRQNDDLKKLKGELKGASPSSSSSSSSLLL